MSVVRIRSDGYYVIHIRGSLSWVASVIVGFIPGASSETYLPVWTWHIASRLPISHLYVSGGGIICVSCDTRIRVPPVVCVFPWEIPQLQNDWSLSCDYGLDHAS